MCPTARRRPTLLAGIGTHHFNPDSHIHLRREWAILRRLIVMARKGTVNCGVSDVSDDAGVAQSVKRQEHT